jgi:hypothetical protein
LRKTERLEAEQAEEQEAERRAAAQREPAPVEPGLRDRAKHPLPGGRDSWTDIT